LLISPEIENPDLEIEPETIAAKNIKGAAPDNPNSERQWLKQMAEK
jgi:hypothetical protein